MRGHVTRGQSPPPAEAAARRIARLSPTRRALLERRLEPGGPAAVNGAIPSRASARVPLSFAQQQLWFLHQLDPHGCLYNIPLALRLEGDLDATALQRALTWVEARHEALRTTFPAPDGTPVQVVAPPRPVALRTADVTAAPDPEAAARQRLVDEARHPFDLAADPMLRALLVRCGARAHLLALTLHHIAADGWSLGLLLRELGTGYAALAAGHDPTQPAPRVQYPDYAAWQRRRLDDGRLAELLAYWRAQLAGGPPPLDLPTDFPRPSAQSFRGAEHRFALPAGLADGLRQVARAEGATLFMALLAGFGALLQRYSGRADLAVGTPVANRSREDLEGVIGCFINVVVPRLDLSGDPTFRSLLRRVREVALGAFRHQELPFERLVEELHPVRDPGRNPIFQVLFTLQNAPTDLPEMPGLAVTLVPVHTDTSKFDLALAVEETDTGLSASLEYATDLFRADTAQRLAGHLRTILEAAAADPDRPLSRLPLLTAAERRQLEAWNDTGLPSAPPRCVHELVAQQAAAEPEATCVVFEGEGLTCRQLDERANQLAHRLGRLGVRPDARVGLCVERSLDLAVGLLGILKAGGAYVPLDPAYPRERLAFMAADAGLAVLVTQPHLRAALPHHTAPVVCLGGDDLSAEPIWPPDAGVAAHHLAYVIYTSGSTGRPKGVMVEHRNVASFFTAMDGHLHPERERGVWLAVTSPSFDISVLELLWTLARGWQVVLWPGHGGARPASVPAGSGNRAVAMAFSLFYFASDEGQAADRYRLLLEGARFADEHGFAAVWTPERHFHAFGGLYPNPSVAAAALAASTRRVHIRAGSVVLPLHDPIRVAEEWALVDNLSGGRVGISFASGWQANDFVLAPDAYEGRKERMFRDLEVVRRLWRGEPLSRQGPHGPVAIRTLPRPLQAELPVWVTAAGSPDTFRAAGQIGANLLTHLLGQGVEELAGKIALFRQARREAGHDPGCVTVMVHTFVGRDEDEVRETVRGPMTGYLRSSVGLIAQAAATAPALQERARQTGASPAQLLESRQLSEEDMQALLDHAFERYVRTSGLFGTPDTCLEMVARLAEAGADEIACLIDFGVPTQVVLEHLVDLDAVRERAASAPARRAPAGSASDPPATVASLVARHGITHLQCTPSMARVLVADDETRQALGRLRALLVGGEALPTELSRRLRAAVTGDLLNLYGPTETTVWSAAYPVAGGEDPVPIGRPLANTALHVLDGNLQPVPIGHPGELFIGGRGVVRGYLGRPDLTQERFIPDPGDGGDRLYRTGDLARYRPDGNLEFLGRLDHQVKLRGHRIELGEIESVLDQHPSVRASVAAVRPDGTGDPRLVAYVVPSGSTPDEQALRDHLRRQLPEYMVPARIVWLDAFPLTPNGKIDRKALPAPDAGTAAEAALPGDELEGRLLRLWEELLDRRPIAASDNFFDLGGHSLLAVGLFARIEEELGRKLPLATLFQAPTVARLAAVLRQEGEGPAWSALVPIQPEGDRPPLYFVHAHGGNVLGYRDLARRLGDDQPFYGVQAPPPQGPDGAPARIEEMAARYVQELRAAQPRGPYVLGGWCMGGVVALEMARDLEARGEEVALVAMVQTGHPDYPQYLPGRSRARGPLRSLRRLDLEASNILEVPPGARRAYAWARICHVCSVLAVAAEGGARRLLSPLGLHLPVSRAARLEALAGARQRAYAEYEPAPYAGPVVLFRARKQPLGIRPDPTLGWGGRLPHLTTYEVPGHAIGILSEPRVGAVATRLRACIDEARRAPAAAAQPVPSTPNPARSARCQPPCPPP